MSKYTTLLRFPIEQHLHDLKLDYSEKNWVNCYKLLGLDDYPIFDELYRETLNTKIIRRYYFREIGFETMGLFRWKMHETMHEIMPYYNQLYKSQDLITEPMFSRNMSYSEIWSRDEKIDSLEKETADTKVTDDATSSSSNVSDMTTDSTTNSRNVFQDTPMNGLDTGAIKNMDYATNVTYDDSKDSSKTHSKSDTSSKSHDDRNTDYDRDTTRNELGDYDGTKQHNERGYDGSQAELLLTYRKTFINIDLDIVNNLNDLFMGLW